MITHTCKNFKVALIKLWLTFTPHIFSGMELQCQASIRGNIYFQIICFNCSIIFKLYTEHNNHKKARFGWSAQSNQLRSSALVLLFAANTTTSTNKIQLLVTVNPPTAITGHLFPNHKTSYSQICQTFQAARYGSTFICSDNHLVHGR